MHCPYLRHLRETADGGHHASATCEAQSLLPSVFSLSTQLLALVAEWEARQIIMHCGVRISVLSVTLRNATTAVCVHDHQVEIEFDAERRRRLTRVQVSDTVEQRMIPGGNNERPTDVGTTSFVPTLVSLSLLLPPTVTALISWLIYKCSNTVEQRMIPGGSNDERLNDMDTRNS